MQDAWHVVVACMCVCVCVCVCVYAQYGLDLGVNMMLTITLYKSGQADLLKYKSEKGEDGPPFPFATCYRYITWWLYM